MSTVGCPTRREWSEFAVGKLPQPRLDRLADHAQQCPACEALLADLDQASDPLLTEVRQSGMRSGSDGSTPLPQRYLQAALAAGQVGAAGGSGPPRRLGKFELLEELGAGSFGYVYRARDTELERMVALKILRAGSLASRDEVERFLREARSAAQLKHPGIVSLYESGQTTEGACYLVEELVEGITLADRLNRGPVNVRQAAAWVIEVAEALDYAHRQGVIHRDIKPSNIMLDGEGRLHLTDFGLAKRDAEEAPVTPEGEVLGTPAYMSPEQARGDSRLVDARSDLYSLGVILYELLSGERPFRGNRRMLILQVLEDEPRPPRRLNDKIPRDVETICLKAMAKAQTRRYASAAELAEISAAGCVETPYGRPIGFAEQIWRWRRRNPVAASLFLAVTFGSAFGLWHLSQLSEQLVQSTAIDSAAQESEMLEVVNEDYSKIVDRLAPYKVQVTHDYLARSGAIPLPATLTIDLGKHISEKSSSGMQVRMYSDHPFKGRKDGGPKDAFERQALDQLGLKPGVPVWSFEEVQGKPSLRYATARRMDETCVRCHNTHPDSTKKDWKVGDVPGVLEIIRPLDRDIARARQGLRGTFLLMAAISASLLGVSGLAMVVNHRRVARLNPKSTEGLTSAHARGEDSPVRRV